MRSDFEKFLWKNCSEDMKNTEGRSYAKAFAGTNFHNE